MYEVNWKVRFSECDSNQRLRYGEIVNYFQDCSNLQSLEIGRGLQWLNERKRAWMLDFWHIEVVKRPECFEDIQVLTWPNGFKGFLGTRNFVMKSSAGELLAYANSNWVYLDTETGKPTRVTEEEQKDYSVEPALEMENVGRKVEVPQMMEFVKVITVESRYIDVYQHMNNERYVEIAVDALPEGTKIHRICCQYRMQAKCGEQVHVYRKIIGDKVYVALKSADDKVYAALSFES
ncbi:MAG: acyl-[acyl-carrier-protein] thioesterase [Lachnospiraceae bacterium]